MRMRRRQTRDSEQGVALLAAVLAVAVLLAIGLSFSFNMRLEEKAAANYLSGLQAKFVAEAGIQYAVAKLRDDADPGTGTYKTTEHDYLGEDWNPSSGSITGNFALGAGKTGTYTVTVVDTAARIYINDFINVSLGTVLEALVDALRKTEATVLENGDGANVYSNRPTLANGGYTTKKQIRAVSGSTIDAGDYSALSNYISAEGYFEAGLFNGTTPVNINTADQFVLQAIFDSVSVTDRDRIVQAIMEYRTGKKYTASTSTSSLDVRATNPRWTQNGSNVGNGDANPFDGIDSNRSDLIDPIVSNFGTDTLDNDGDGTPDPGDTDEAYMFAGGARGEFNTLIDYLRDTGSYGNGSGKISPGTATTVKNNADPTQTFDPSPIGLDFESKFFEITSTGTITQAGETLAESKIVRIVEREQ